MKYLTSLLYQTQDLKRHDNADIGLPSKIKYSHIHTYKIYIKNLYHIHQKNVSSSSYLDITRPRIAARHPQLAPAQ